MFDASRAIVDSVILDVISLDHPLQIGHHFPTTQRLIMATEWHYTHGDQQLGPVSSSQLKAFVADGTIQSDTLVWKNGLKSWIPARKIKGLFPDTPQKPVIENRPPPLPSGKSASSLGSNETIVAAKKIAADVTSDVRKNFHLQRIVIIACASLGILSTFLPWVSMPIVGAIYGTAGDGWITLCLFIPALVLAFRGDKLAPLIGGSRLGAAIPAGIAGLIGLGEIMQFNLKVAEAGNDNPFAQAFAGAVQIRFGIYLLVASGVAVCVTAWLLEKRVKVAIDD